MNTQLTLLCGTLSAWVRTLFFLFFFLLSSIYNIDAKSPDNIKESPPMASLIYDDGGTHTLNLTGAGIAFYNQILVTNNTSLTINTANYLQVRITGDGNNATDDLLVESGSTLTLTTNTTLILRYQGSGITSNIGGTLNMGTAGSTQIVYYQPNSSANVTNVSGEINTHDGTRIDAVASSLQFLSGSIYRHKANHTNNQLPIANWQTGSKVSVEGYASNSNPPLNLNQSFYDFEWNSPNQTASTSFAGAQPTFFGTFRVISTGSGKLRFNHTASNVTFNCMHFEQTGGEIDMAQGIGDVRFKVSGNFNRSGGLFGLTGSSVGSIIEFNGSSAQIANMGSLTGHINFIINNSGGVNGQLPVNTGADLTMTSGTLNTSPIYSGSNGLIYNGSNVQTAGMEWNGTINRLTIETPLGIIANGDLTVTDELNLNGGNVNLGLAQITLGASPSQTGTYNYTSGLLIGKFKRWVSPSAASWDFNVGTTNLARTANVTFTIAPVSGGSLTSEFIEASPGTSGLPVTFGAISVAEISPTGYWRVEAGDGLTGGTYSISVNASGFTFPNGSPITQSEKIRLIKRPTGGDWTAEGNPATPSSLSSISSSDLFAFSEFGAGIGSAILPIELSHFSASQKGASNEIIWTTASQQNTSKLHLEKRQNGQGWTLLNTMEIEEDSNSETNFSYLDFQPSCLTYYRLRSIDLNGAESVFPAVAVERQCDDFNVSKIYPNPAQHHVNIQIESTDYQDVVFKLSNSFGQILESGTWEIEPGSSIRQLPIEWLTPGIYHLSFFDGKKWSLQMFMKN